MCLMSMWVGLLIGTSGGAVTIQSQVSELGTNSSGEAEGRYTYFVSDLTLQSTQELDFRFDPALFDMISNPVADAAFSTLVLQPNNPPGVHGDYTLTPVADGTTVTGPFSIDFTYIGPGLPG